MKKLKCGGEVGSLGLGDAMVGVIVGAGMVHGGHAFTRERK